MKNVIDTHVEEAEIRGEERGIEKGIGIGREEGIAIGLEKGREEGREKGREEGGLEKAIEIAKTMIEQGFDDANITLLTQLSVEQIQALREHNN